jgi:hypothetical protein
LALRPRNGLVRRRLRGAAVRQANWPTNGQSPAPDAALDLRDRPALAGVLLDATAAGC